MSTPTLLRMTAPLREDFDIPYHDFGPPAQAPAVALVAGLHGNELNGIFVLARLAGYLRRIDAGERSGQRLAKRVIVVPAVNVLGVNTRSRRWPFDGTDINRMFPGSATGTFAQQLAYRIAQQVISPADALADLHGGDVFESLASFVGTNALGDERDELVLRAARATSHTATATATKLRNPCQLRAKLEPPVMLGSNGRPMAAMGGVGMVTQCGGRRVCPCGRPASAIPSSPPGRPAPCTSSTSTSVRAMPSSSSTAARPCWWTPARR